MLGLLLGTPARVREVAVPPGARALSTLSDVDYEDATSLEVERAGHRTGEEWARAILEDAPMPTRRALQSGWFALGLQLGSARPDRGVLGWEIRSSAADFALLAARSRLGLTAEVLCKRDERTVLLATFLRHENSLARALWVGVGPGHRQVVRYLLVEAGRREARDRRP